MIKPKLIGLFILGLFLFLGRGGYSKYKLYQTYTYGKKIDVRVIQITDICERGKISRKSPRIIFHAEKLDGSEKYEVLSDWKTCCLTFKEGDIISVKMPLNGDGRLISGELSIASELLIIILMMLVIIISYLFYLIKVKK